MGFFSDLVSNPSKAFGSDLTGGSSAIGQAGQAIGICGRAAISNPLVDALAGAALAYFDPLSMVSGLGGLTGLSMGANAGLITGGLAGLSTGNLKTGLQAGLAGWTGGSLASGIAGSAASEADAINQLGTQQLQPTAAQTASNNAIGVAQPYDTVNYTANPVAANPATAGTGASNPLSAATTTAAPSAAPVVTPSATASNPSMLQQAKNYIISSYEKCAPLTIAAGLGATGLAVQGLKKASSANTVSAPASPSSNVIREYSYNPSTGQYAAGPVINASNFGTQPIVPVNYCNKCSTYTFQSAPQQSSQNYNTMTGDSKNAYNFLSGQTNQPKITGNTYQGQVAVPYLCYAQNPTKYALGGITALNHGGQAVGHLGGYSDGGRLLRGPGDGVSDSIPATIGAHNPEPARLADGEFVVPARIVSELGNGSTEAGARKLYQMMDRVQKNRARSVGHNKVAVNSHSDKFLPA